MNNFPAESTDIGVFWTWHYTTKWDVVSIVDTINSRILKLCDWFHVEFAKRDNSGRLTLQTTTASHTFCSLPSLEMAAKSFLGKFIEVCDLKKYLEDEQLIHIDVISQLNENKGNKLLRIYYVNHIKMIKEYSFETLSI